MLEAERMAMEFVRAKKPRAYVDVGRAELKSADHWTVRGTLVEKVRFAESVEDWVVEIQSGKVVSCDFKLGAGFITK